MKAFYDVVVVGGGPAGSVAAWHAARGGASVLLLEKDRDIGPPVRCAEGVGAEGLKLIIEPREHFIENRIEGVNLFAPNGRKVHMETDDIGFVLNRKVFDRYLAEVAAKSGAEIHTKAYVDGLLFDDGKVAGVTFLSQGRRFSVRSHIVIGADGVESRVGRWAGIRTQLKLKDLETCAQYTLANISVDARYCDFYFSRELAPGGYLWIFPKGDGIANVGLGISGADAQKGASPKRLLDRFLAEHFPGAAILTTTIGGVPVASTLKQIVKPGLMLVGDAARQANPVSGGGIVSGMIAGKLAGQTAAEAVSKGNFSERFLKRYEKRWYQEEGNNHKTFYRIKEAIYRLSDDDLNKIAESFLALPEEDRTLGALFKTALFRRPELVFDAMMVFKDQLRASISSRRK